MSPTPDRNVDARNDEILNDLKEISSKLSILSRKSYEIQKNIKKINEGENRNQQAVFNQINYAKP